MTYRPEFETPTDLADQYRQETKESGTKPEVHSYLARLPGTGEEAAAFLSLIAGKGEA